MTSQNAPQLLVSKCDQGRLVCAAGDKPAGAKVRRPVVWIAGRRVTKALKPIDKVSLGEATSHRAVTTVNAMWPRKSFDPKAEPTSIGRRQHGVPKSDRCGTLHFGGVEATARRQGHTEQLAKPSRPGAKSPEQGRSYNWLKPGKRSKVRGWRMGPYEQ